MRTVHRPKTLPQKPTRPRSTITCADCGASPCRCLYPHQLLLDVAPLVAALLEGHDLQGTAAALQAWLGRWDQAQTERAARQALPDLPRGFGRAVAHLAEPSPLAEEPTDPAELGRRIGVAVRTVLEAKRWIGAGGLAGEVDRGS